MKTNKFYLIHWNIRGNLRQKKGSQIHKVDTFKSVVDLINKHNLSVLFCVNEINNNFIKHKYKNVITQGIDISVSGRAKKSNILLITSKDNKRILNSVACSNVNFIGEGYPSFKHRVVIANLCLNNQKIKIMTIHSPTGSRESKGVSGEKIKANFFALMLSILKREKPDIITMDANEPERYDTNILNWVFWDNRFDQNGVVEAKKTFHYLFQNYKLLKNGPTYSTQYYDHLFYKNRKLNVIMTNALNKLLDKHTSDHKPITVEVII